MASSPSRSRALTAANALILLLSLTQEHSLEAFTTSKSTGILVQNNNPAGTTNRHLLHAQSTKSAEASATYGIDAPYKEANYDPHAAAEYYKDRPIESLSRLTQIVSKSSGFIVDTILDTLQLNISAEMISFYRLRVLLLSLAAIQLANGFILSSQRYVTNNMINHCRKVVQPPLFMADHSAVTSLSVGDAVTVVQDVLKAGKNLRGLSGTVTETWEKCDVDPTCCCAEFVDENLAVHVRFNTCEENELFGNDTFIHYFAEAELVKMKEEECEEELDDGGSASIAFDGLSCTAFKRHSS